MALSNATILSRQCLSRLNLHSRCFHVSPVSGAEFGWFNKFINIPKPASNEQPQTGLLADINAVYELQKEDVQPGHMDDYLKSLEYFVHESRDKTPGYELVGSFRVLIGDQDQVLNLWRFDKGYVNASMIQSNMLQDSALVKLENDRLRCLRKRENQMLLAFSFWDTAVPAQRNGFYELRSYVLKTGSLLDWGNAWAKGIHCRHNRVAGYFSQVGRCYMVYHLWHYKDLQERQDVRQSDWINPGWDVILRDTLPLIREMRSRWMVGNSFSPIR
ncbi:protein nipsnap [Brevipalpus obovatus]|uniref:protein nipsnap n=1 Tax=Brevipalpus obovatus TaxID=246614 RepID=UPI003D9DFD9E